MLFDDNNCLSLFSGTAQKVQGSFFNPQPVIKQTSLLPPISFGSNDANAILARAKAKASKKKK